jgi:copper resistance protein B
MRVLSRLALASLALVATAAVARAQSPDHGHATVLTFFQADQFEYRYGKGDHSFHWDLQGWIGTDDEKFWFKSEGEMPTKGVLEDMEIQALYSWRISDFFDAQAGIRYDYRPGPQRGFAVLGVQGLAPYFLEVDAALFVSHKGEVSARLQGEYDLLITQSLILQPRAEVNLALQNVEARGIGAGISDVELGLRLRYEITREFAPYIGVSWTRKLFRTASYAKDEGERISALSLVAGVRFWF